MGEGAGQMDGWGGGIEYYPSKGSAVLLCKPNMYLQLRSLNAVISILIYLQISIYFLFVWIECLEC